jgi:hypothetical protein
MRCKFSLVTGFGKYCTCTCTADISSVKTARADVERYIDSPSCKADNPVILGYVISSIFDCSAEKTKKNPGGIKIIKELSKTEFEKQVKHVQDLARKSKKI